MKYYKDIKLNPLPERELEIIGSITAEKMAEMREKALKKFKVALEKARSSGDYEQVADSRMALGRTYVETQQFDEAQKQFQEILKIRESEKKLQALDATEAMNELGKIYRSRGQYAQAQQFFNRALSIRKGYTGADHAAVAETLADLGNLALAQKQFKKASDLLSQAESVASSTQGLADINQANIFSAIPPMQISKYLLQGNEVILIIIVIGNQILDLDQTFFKNDRQ